MKVRSYDGAPTVLATEHSDNTLVTMVMALMATMGDKKHDDKGWWVIILLLFLFALIFLAVFMKDGKKDGNLSEVVAATIATKAGDGFGGSIQHLEDRMETRRTQGQIEHLGTAFQQLGFGLSNQIKDVEIKGLENFAKLEHQNGLMQAALSQLLQGQNNDAIISGLMNRLLGVPCSR